MIVRCANCQTEFSLDDRQVGPEGAQVRCSVCLYVFGVEPPVTREASWQIRTVEALSFTSPDLPTLRQWIREGRLHPDDQVSRTGKNWLRLGDMPEFSEVFRGFGGLPEVFVEMAADHASAMDALGPPPSFGTETDGTPIEALVPAPSELIDVRSVARDGSGPLAAADGSREAQAELDETTVSAVLARPATETPSGRYRGVPAGMDRVERSPDPSAVPVEIVDDDLDQDELDQDDLDQDDLDQDELDQDEPELLTGGAGNTAVVRHAEIAEAVEQARRELLADAGVPRPIPRRHSSRPLPAAHPEDGAPASMLDAVTAHVKPITRAAIESDSRKPVGDPSDSLGSEGAPAGLSRAELMSASGSSLTHAAASRRSPPPKDLRDGRSGGRAWPLYAGLGLLVGVAVVFGIPDIRTRVLGWAGIVVGQPEQAEPTGLPLAREQTQRAIRSLDPAAIDAMGTTLAAQVDASTEPAVQAGLALLRTELVAAVVFESRIKAAIALQAALAAGRPVPAVVDTPSGAAAELETAVQALPQVATRAADPVAVARAEVRAAVARAVVPKSLAALGQDPVANELQLLAIASPWLTEPSAKVPAGLIGGLAELPEPSATTSLLLALSYWRAGDETRALAEGEGLLARAPNQPTAQALVAAVRATSESGQGVSAGPTAPNTAAGGDVAGDEADSDDAPTIVDDPEPDPGTDPGPAAPRLSTDQLIERGCDKVEAGDGKGGVEDLKRAFERRPRDVDILTCLGAGYAKMGQNSSALSFFERALAVAPSFRPALAGAAGAAAKLSRTKPALRYYEALLELDPSHEKALAYVQAHRSNAEGPAPDDGADAATDDGG